MIRTLQIAALGMMALLFPIYAILSSVLKVPFTISGVDRMAWIAGCMSAYAILFFAPLIKMLRERKLRFDKLDVVGLIVVFCALWVYPQAVRWWCDRENARRADTWHWITDNDGLYYFVDNKNPDAFAGHIEVYPPYFSMPKHR